MISEYGLYVVEVKNHHGAIYGKKNQTTWRQERGKSIKYFKNPLKQLSQEIKLLSKTLNSFHIHVPIQGCVFFSNVKRLRVDTNDVLMNDDLLLEKIQQERVPIIKKVKFVKSNVFCVDFKKQCGMVSKQVCACSLFRKKPNSPKGGVRMKSMKS